MGPSAVGTVPSSLDVVSGPSEVRTLPGASDVISGPSEVCTLPSASDVGLVPPHPCGSTGWLGGEEAGAAAAGEFPKLPLSVSFFSLFLFEKFLLLNPAALYKEGPVLSHGPPL